MSQTKTLYIWTDGGARRNPGPAGVGVLVKDQTQTLAELSRYIGQTTNNQAEYQALITALDWVANHHNPKETRLELYTDSELMAYQIQGRYRVKNQELASYYQRAMTYLELFQAYTIAPVPREKNQIADGLVNKAGRSWPRTKSLNRRTHLPVSNQ